MSGTGGRWRSEPGKGRIIIGQWSSLRKLMRAARRGTLPAWWPTLKKDVEAMRTRHVHPRSKRGLEL